MMIHLYWIHIVVSAIWRSSQLLNCFFPVTFSPHASEKMSVSPAKAITFFKSANMIVLLVWMVFILSTWQVSSVSSIIDQQFGWLSDEIIRPSPDHKVYQPTKASAAFPQKVPVCRIIFLDAVCSRFFRYFPSCWRKRVYFKCCRNLSLNQSLGLSKCYQFFAFHISWFVLVYNW